MSELLEFLEDLKSIQALPETMQPAAVDRAVEKYQTRFTDQEADMERQYELFFGGTVFQAPFSAQKAAADMIKNRKISG
jgi:hypothetical protein